MKQIFALLTALGLFHSSAFSQTGKLAGTVTDGSQKNMESATISLLRAKDSAAVKFSVTNKEGVFAFDGVASGHYLVSVSAVGHEKAYSPLVEVSAANASVQLKTIVLVPQPKAMGAVTVTARKPLIEQKVDRTVVNVDASVTNAGSTALEVLEKSPGLSVDKDGNISLKGKQGVVVLIDGRPTQLGGADLANLLRSMGANQLDQIEIMTNPPAKYDAAGNAGLINIKTKKNKQLGYNGSVNASYGQGIYYKVNDGLNFNYRQGKWNLFTNGSHYDAKRSNRLTIQRNFLDNATKVPTSHFDQVANMKNGRRGFNGKVGADYFADKNTTVGLVVSGFDSRGTFENRNVTDISKGGKLDNQTRALSQQRETFSNIGTNLNFRRVLDSTGRELTADLDFMRYDGNSHQTLSNYYYLPSGEAARQGDTLYGQLPQAINIYSGRIDYTTPLKGGARFEAGLKTSIVKTDNNAIYDTVNNGMVVRDAARSNHFLYEENINAAYVNLSGKLGKNWNGQLGLRAENTNAKGNQVTTKETFNRHYTQLFPTAYLQYTANDKNSFVLNYGRRIRRPNYESLNPFIEYLDRYTSQQGNPNLKPQFSHNVEMSHTYKGFLTTTLNYTQTTDIIQQVIEQNEATNETYVKQANIANQRQWGVVVSLNKSINKWWTNSFYVNAFNNRFEGLVNNTPVTISAATLMLNGSQQFKLNKTLTAELSGWYRTAGIEGVIVAKAMGALNAGFSQQVMKDKGTLRLTVRDIFFTQRFRGASKYGNVDAAFQERNDSRVVTLGFTYRFSKGKVGGVKRRGSSAGEEANRVGGGN